MGKKNTETAECGEKERLHFYAYAAEWAWSCEFNERKQARKTEKTKNTNRAKIKKAQYVYSRSYLKALTCFKLYLYLSLLMQAAHLKTPHISGALGKISSVRKNLTRISRYFLLLFVQPDSWWCFRVVHKLAQNNSRSHCNYILLTLYSFVCVSTVCVYNAWTRCEPPVSSSGLWALCLFLADHLIVVWVH